jgi:hypothetical protein
MMKVFAFFVLFAAAVLAQSFNNQDPEDAPLCLVEYQSPLDQSFYEFLMGWENATDQNGNIWFFTVCDLEISSPCSSLDTLNETVNVCQQINGQLYNKGTFDTEIFSDSANGAGQGFEVMFGVESDTPVKTLLQFVCSYDTPDSVSVNVVDDTLTIITYNSALACPISDDYSSDYGSINPFFFIIRHLSLALIAIGCVCCCCAIRMRRRRVQQQTKDIAMKQFSNVAFQPIPQTNATFRQAPNPNVAQPQFVYYYPSQQNGAVPTQPQVFVNKMQESSDEKIARDLQAQFDRESQV